MRTRSQARKRRQPQVRQTSVESSNLEKPDNPPIVTMADNRTMAQLLEAPTEGYEDAIVIPEITTNNFEIKHGLLNLVQNKQFFGNDKEDPMLTSVSYTKITSTNEGFRTYQIRRITSGSGTLPGNTVTNPKEDLKGITTRSGTIQGPKAVSHDTEVTKDTMPPANNGSTEDVQPPVVQIQSRNPNPEHKCARKKQTNKLRILMKSSKEMNFEISFLDALTLMPKFASTLKALIGNKEKLSEMAKLNETCSAVILNKLPRKLGDPGRFLIPCEFSGINTCNALADLGASINLMPYSVWKDLSLSELTPTCMTLELADRSITTPIGIAKDVR
ncbi:reverse transcriptase domain-containing protein [Tanacetum coccineum]|uniref:Reverse transcriptase domain-containing protein n=1 Tax=Tanacetum coccineum TaxID=301880 RepID=A0ABQ4ZKZ6_9ASTR